MFSLPINNCTTWQNDELKVAIGKACGTALPEVRLITLQDGNLLTSLKEKKVVVVWDPQPQSSPYGTPFFHEDKNNNGSLVKRSVKEEFPEERENVLRSLQKWFDEGSSYVKRSPGKEFNEKMSLNGRTGEKSSETTHLKMSFSENSFLKKRSSHVNPFEKRSSENTRTLDEGPSKKIAEEKGLIVERSTTKRSTHKAKRELRPLFQLCQEFPGNIYVLVDADHNLVYKVKTLKCNADGCFIASNRFKIGECIVTKKMIVLQISDGCNGLKPFTVEVGCNCNCLKNLQFL